MPIKRSQLATDASFVGSEKETNEAEAFGRFFVAFREHDAAFTAELPRFFHQFKEHYRLARSTRAAATPHFDVLRVFGLEFAELRHSDALAWFLDPEAEHEQGALFANALLRFAGAEAISSEAYIVDRERHARTDVAFYASGKFAVFIENKVRHFEREKQVLDMIDSLTKLSNTIGVPRERRFGIFLTDSGAKPVTGPEADSAEFLVVNLISTRRVDLFESFRSALEKQPVYSPLLMNFIDSYLEAIRRLREQLT
jgi:hypothetical protein